MCNRPFSCLVQQAGSGGNLVQSFGRDNNFCHFLGGTAGDSKIQLLSQSLLLCLLELKLLA